MPTETAQLKQTYEDVRQRIGEAAARSGRREQDVLMVAVTKTATPDQIRALVEMGHMDFGENRVQQLTQRVAQLDEFLQRRQTLGEAAEEARPALPGQVRWHMIGHLQRNKIKQVAPVVKLIHSVDTLRLAEELHNYGAKHEQEIDILLQINASGEAGKHGITPPAALHLLEQIDTMMYLRPRGLMTMAPYSEQAEDARPTFQRTAELFHDLRTQGVAGDMFNILSMGMTHDFEIAIEEGANLVRLGRCLFGENT